MPRLPEKSDIQRHYKTLHPFNFCNGAPPPPVVITDKMNDDDDLYEPKPYKKKPMIRVIPSTSTMNLPDPRLDPTQKKRITQRSKPYFPKPKGLLIPITVSNQKIETFIPRPQNSRLQKP